MATDWIDTVKAQVTSDIAKAKASMQLAIGGRPKRQPNVRPQIVQAIAFPQQFPADARARLAAMLYTKYGEQARNVMPYLGLDAESEAPSAALGGI